MAEQENAVRQVELERRASLQERCGAQGRGAWRERAVVGSQQLPHFMHTLALIACIPIRALQAAGGG